jgi:hypothetical protein
MILAVDLAAKFSGSCLMDWAASVVGEWHSWQRTEDEWVRLLAYQFSQLDSREDSFIVIEDMPFNVGQTKTVRDVYRLQGRILQHLKEYGYEKYVVWIPPALWQYHFKPLGMTSGNKKAAKEIATTHYGYSPPELLHKDLHGVDRVHARKTMEDHIDAFLIARYMFELKEKHGSFTAAVDAVPRLERFESGN